LYEKYKSQGLEVLAFPSNEFGGQEPGGVNFPFPFHFSFSFRFSLSLSRSFCLFVGTGTNQQIKETVQKKFNVTFQMFDKIEVNGPNAHPLFKYLKAKCPDVNGREDVKWNFSKFLVDRKGNPVKRFGSMTQPLKMEEEIKALLAAK
jgi:glutathione peroxidase